MTTQTSVHKSLIALAVLLAALIVSVGPAAADNLVTDLSENLIAITSNFTGQQIVFFGTIDRDATPLTQDPGLEGPRDIIVVIRGPREPITVRHKERVFGVWANVGGVDFDGVPGYYFVASNRDFEAMATQAVFQRHQIGAENLRITTRSEDVDEAALKDYKSAIIRSKREEKLFIEEPGGVQFLDGNLFRANVEIPANVPVGIYRTEVYLVQGGNVISVQSKPLYIDKSGIERSIYEFAYDRPASYGIAAVLFALLSGWVASWVFRQN